MNMQSAGLDFCSKDYSKRSSTIYADADVEDEDAFFHDAYECARSMNTAECEFNFQSEITQTPLLSMFSSMRAFSFALTPL